MAYGQPTEDSFLDIQLLFMTMGGILPPRGEGKTCKKFLYNVYCLTILIWYIPSITAQWIAFVGVLDDVGALTGILFEVLSAMLNYMAIAYMLTRRSQIYSVIDNVKYGFKDTISNLPFKEKHREIILSAAKRNVIFSRSIMISISISLAMWIIRPLALRLIYETTNDKYLSEEYSNSTEDIRWDLFCYQIWLPPNPMEPKTYILIWIFQIFPSFLIATTFLGYNSTFYGITSFLTAHFKILTTFLDDVNYMIDEDVPPEFKKSIEESHNLGERIQNEKISSNIPSKLDVREKVDNKVELKEINLAQKTDIYEYLVNCIKYHQAILKLCDEVEELYNPLLFMFFSMDLGIMCTCVFRATMVQDDENFSKFVSASFSVWVPIYLVCWFGENVSTESGELKDHAYSCHWYNSTSPIKKLLAFLIMRSQKPVIFTAGKFIPVNLQGFSGIANNVYAYFTILQQMQADK